MAYIYGCVDDDIILGLSKTLLFPITVQNLRNASTRLPKIPLHPLHLFSPIPKYPIPHLKKRTKRNSMADTNVAGGAAGTQFLLYAFAWGVLDSRNSQPARQSIWSRCERAPKVEFVRR
jgi:hypothetical protein